MVMSIKDSVAAEYNFFTHFYLVKVFTAEIESKKTVFTYTYVHDIT